MAVLMHKYQGMDYKEISKVLKLSESATKSLLFRAYETLRSHAPRLTRDRSLAPDIERVAAALRRGEFDV